MITERLYYQDATLCQFQATLIGWSDDGAALLDRTAFYPTSGGQDHDTGHLNDVSVVAVEDHGDMVAHVLEEPHSERLAIGAFVTGSINSERRFELMQHHTGQHLLSALALEMFAWETASVHIGVGSATVEFAIPIASAEDLAALETRANHEIAAAHPVTAHIFAPGEAPPLRKAATREGALRVLTIEGLDQSACGGTHVSSTAQIGCLLLGGVERIRKQLRIEFACGTRAMVQAGRQRDLLAETARALQCHVSQLPGLVARQRDELLELGKREKSLARALSTFRGRAARQRLVVSEDAAPCAVRWVAENPTEADRDFATAFCEQPAALLTVCGSTGAFLLCCHPASGLDAKQWLNEHASALGAKGGGSPTMVSGRLVSADQSSGLISLLPASPVVLEDELD